MELGVDATTIKERLDGKVFAQEMATQIVEDCLQTCVAGLANEDKPLAVLLFAGSTGSGKTELSKQLAKIMFDDTKSLHRFDMTEYSQSSSVERFRDEVTRRVWERPFSVLLFDEIEKACGDVTRMLLQITDDARLVNRHNKEVSFKNCYIILTTNAGAEIYETIARYMVSDTGKDNRNMMRLMPLIKQSLMNTMGENKFPPELLGRLTAIVPFQPLSEKTMLRIAEAKLKEIQQMVKHKHNIRVRFSPKVLDYVIKDNLTTESNDGGARSVINKLNSEIVTAIARYINTNKRIREIDVQIVGELVADNKLLLESNAYVEIIGRK